MFEVMLSRLAIASLYCDSRVLIDVVSYSSWSFCTVISLLDVEEDDVNYISSFNFAIYSFFAVTSTSALL